MGQVCYLIVSIPDLCTRAYFVTLYKDLMHSPAATQSAPLVAREKSVLSVL